MNPVHPKPLTLAAALWAAVSFSAALQAAPLASPSLSPGEDIRRENGEVTVNATPVTVIRYTWRDSAGRPRSVSLVPASGLTSGYAVQITYQVNDGMLRTVEVNAMPGANGDEGFGYFVSHEAFRDFIGGGSGTLAAIHGDDDSPLGRNLASTGSTSSAGSRQAAHEFRLSYPRWGTIASIPSPSDTLVDPAPGAHQKHQLPVIIRWTFVAGYDYPLWSVEHDLSSVTDKVAVDMRGPYGVMRFNEGNGADVSVLRWGDVYQFSADAVGADIGQAALVPGGIAWAWDQPNIFRRYNVLGSGSYEFGIVSTEPPIGGAYNLADGYSDSRGHASPGGCAYGLRALPCDFEWAYQSFQYDAGPPARPKLAWGTSPFLGTNGCAFNGEFCEARFGTGRLSYNVHIVTGKLALGTPLTMAWANASSDGERLLTMWNPAGGSVTYEVLGDATGPHADTRWLRRWASVKATAVPAPGFSFLSWSGDVCVDVAALECIFTMDANRIVGASFAAAPLLSLSVSTLDFGPVIVNTLSESRPIVVTNTSAGVIVISDVQSSGTFVQANNCGTLQAGASCTIDVRALVDGATAALGGQLFAGGAVLIYSNAAGSPHVVQLSAVGEKSLVRHYYQAILGRAPDTQGQQFWEGEALRMVSLGASINETWFVMAGYFFNSPEYLAANKPTFSYVSDLYRTFFNREGDLQGLGFWSSQIVSGLPREVVLLNFMFSAEFATFTQGIFGNTAVRPEVNIVMDFFRGILNRLPDTSSFQYWLGQIRAAQCQGAGPVYTAVDSISTAFVFNPEYANRARSNTQYVTDMYYSFLRRGGDLGGVNFWISRLQSGAMDANTVRLNFLNSPEFGARVQAVIAAGCYTGP